MSFRREKASSRESVNNAAGLTFKRVISEGTFARVFAAGLFPVSFYRPCWIQNIVLGPYNSTAVSAKEKIPKAKKNIYRERKEIL